MTATWVAVGAVGAWLAFAPARASAASNTPRTAAVQPPPRPVLEPVNVHALASSVGGKADWVERGKKLRLRNARCEIIFEVARREMLVDGLRVFLGEAPVLRDGSLAVSPVDRDRVLLPLLVPQNYGTRPVLRTIVLDAGHGGKDQGTRHDPLQLREKDLALDMVQRLQRQLEARGYRVVLTRRDDSFIDLVERPRLAAGAGADLFLSVHFNAGPPSVNGIETYRLTPQYLYSTSSDKLEPTDNLAVPGNVWDAWNTLLGYSIHRQLQQDVGRFDRGLKHARFVVIRDLIACPGVLIECGYLSNAAEAQLIAQANHREKLAAAIAAGVDAYVGLFPAAPTEPASGVASPSTNPPSNPGATGAIRAPRSDSAR